MAGSRLQHYGTIFTRVTGLMEAGALKDKPLWYDVYIKYNPGQKPLASQDPIPEIVYEEDIARAKGEKKIRQRSTRKIKDIT